MSTQWKVRAIVMISFIALAGLNLVWSIGQWDTDDEAAAKRNKAEVVGTEAEVKEAPSWANSWFVPQKRIKLGLDLQGGIDLVLQVDVKEAVETALSRSAGSLSAALENKDFSDFQIDKDPDSAQLILTIAEADLAGLREYITDSYSILRIKSHESKGGQAIARLEFTEQHAQTVRENAITQEIEVIRNRIDEFGVSEPIIMAKGDARINVQLPGIDDPDRAIQLLKSTAQLEFHIVDDSVPQSTIDQWILDEAAILGTVWTDDQMNEALADRLPPGTKIYWEREYDSLTKSQNRTLAYLLIEEVPLTGDLLEDATVQFNQTNEPYVQMRLDRVGATIFGRLTRENVKKRLAIVLDHNVKSAPVIREEIPNGVASIEMGGLDLQRSFRDASDLAMVLRAGALPAPVYVEENRTVGATLGADSIDRGLKSMIAGLILVLVLMLVYYRIAGIGACIALIVNLVLLLGILASFEATLTLPGIAGIILTIGMAVDANVIINERIREEIAAGKTPGMAVAAGYDNAFKTILDANITTFLTGIVLFQYGTGPVKGFAVTLMAGIVTSVYTAVVLTRLIFDWRVEKQRIEAISI